MRPWFAQIVGSEGGYTKVSEWVLDTEGINLAQVLCHPDVDFTRTVSNHVPEVIEVLGVEATRNQLLREMRGVIEFDGSYVNYRHLAILTDIMTYRGFLMAITRHGINRNDTGPLMRCSFEESVDILFRAAIFGETDWVAGVSENIMLGQLAPVGTGAFELLLNDDMLQDAIDVQYGAAFDAPDYSLAMTPSHMTPSHSPHMTPSHMGSMMMSPTAMSPFHAGASFSPMVGAGQFSPMVGGGPSMSPGAALPHAAAHVACTLGTCLLTNTLSCGSLCVWFNMFVCSINEGCIHRASTIAKSLPP